MSPRVSPPSRLLLFLAALVTSFAACESVAAPSNESLKFVSEAAQSGAQVLQSSTIAERTSRDSRVRAFAAQLSKEFTQANEDLLLICRRAQINPPTFTPDAATAPQNSGETLDRVYTLEMSQHLAKIQSVYRRAIEGGKLDPELDAFARKQAGALRERATQADALARQQATPN